MEHEIGTFDNLARKSAKYRKLNLQIHPRFTLFFHPIFFSTFSTITFSVSYFKLLRLVDVFWRLVGRHMATGWPVKKIPFSPVYCWFLRNTWTDDNKIGVSRCVSSRRIHWYALQPIKMKENFVKKTWMQKKGKLWMNL